MNDASDQLRSPLLRLQRAALIAAGAGTVLSVLAWLRDHEAFLQAYLPIYLYWWALTVGCMGLSVLNQMVHGRWGYAARPFFDSGLATMWLVVIGFLPIALGLSAIYPWTDPEFFAPLPHTESREWFMQEPFFLGRAAAYLLLLLLLGVILTWRSVLPDGRMQEHTWPRFGGVAAIVISLILTLASIDWIMSLEEEWHSTLFGFVIATGGLVAALGLVTASLALSVRVLQLDPAEWTTPLHDLGKLLLAFVMVWAYIQFSQFLIMYSGDNPISVAYYVDRLSGGWQWLAVFLVVFHFVVPFALLLSRQFKISPQFVAWVALGLVGVQFADVFWKVVPTLHPEGFTFTWMHLVALVALGGFWVAEYTRQLTRRLLPVLNYWPASPSYKSHHG